MNLAGLDQLYRNATDSSAGITFTDGDGIIVHVNDIFCKMTGFAREEFIGKRHADVLRRLDESIDDERLAKHFYHQPQWRGEILMLHKNDSVIWTDTTILPVVNKEGGMDGLFTLSLDITEKKRIERELGNHQQKLGFVLDSLQTAFWEWDMRADTAWFNDNWPRMLGYRPNEVPKDGRAWANFVHPEDRERTLDEVRFHIKEKTPALVCLQRFRHKDGKWVHVMTKGRVVERDENGRATRFIGVNHDISAISRLEDFSVHIQDLAGLGVWDIDLQSMNIHWSRKIYDIFDVDPRLKPYDVTRSINLFAKGHKEKVDKAFNKMIEDGTPYDFEVMLENGKWVRVAGRVDSFEGKPYRAFGIVQDVNDRKIAEEVLRTSQETLQLALDAGQFGVWDWDIPNDEAYWSSTMRALFNADKKRSIFKYEDVRAPVHPEDLPRIEKECQEALNEGDRCDNTYRIKAEDGWRWIRAIANIRRDGNHRAVRMIGVCWDVTSQIETQQAQEQAVIAAEKASKMKSKFMATVSHEIRTPMSGVIGMTELLSESELTAQQREIVQTIKTCGENLLNLVNDILDYSKLEADKVRLDKRPFRLSDTIKNTIDLFNYKTRQKKISLTAEISPDVPDAIMQDEARLYQVLFNLVGNAVKFTNQGSIIVSVSYSNERLHFKVTDSGIGIPKDSLEDIFESFTQVTPGHQTETTGTGLGLAISRSLVELMGGTISVTSEAGKGSCFSFEIDAPQAIINTDAIQARTSSGKVPTNLSQLRVLVVEDNPINLKLLVSILERHEVQIDMAEDGQVAVEKVEANEYDLIFMDVQMPRLDGMSATRAIRASSTIQNQPVIIALTANVSPEHQEECLAAGMNDFLPKPIRVQTIRSLLQLHASRSAGKAKGKSSSPSPNAQEVTSGPVLNRDRLFREFSGFEDLLAQFTDIFLGNYASYLQQIETELANSNLAEVAKAVHTFKGIVGNFQSRVVVNNLELLEDFAKSGNLNAAKDCFRDTTSLIGKLVEEIQALSDLFDRPEN